MSPPSALRLWATHRGLRPPRAHLPRASPPLLPPRHTGPCPVGQGFSVSPPPPWLLPRCPLHWARPSLPDHCASIRKAPGRRCLLREALLPSTPQSPDQPGPANSLSEGRGLWMPRGWVWGPGDSGGRCGEVTRLATRAAAACPGGGRAGAWCCSPPSCPQFPALPGSGSSRPPRACSGQVPARSDCSAPAAPATGRVTQEAGGGER